MRYARYCVLFLIVAGVAVLAPIWPKTVETRGHGHTWTKRADGTYTLAGGSFSYWAICRVPFAYSDYGWITSKPDNVYGPWGWLPGQSWGDKP